QAVRPDRYVFVESVTQFVTIASAADGKTTISLDPPKLRRIWLSVDGTRDGLLRERPMSDPNAWSETPLNGPEPPAYRRDLPTDTDAMLAYLYHNSHGQNPRDQQAFITVGDLIREAYIPPAALSALFSAAARIPGVTVERGAVDASGRHGIA